MYRVLVLAAWANSRSHAIPGCGGREKNCSFNTTISNALPRTTTTGEVLTVGDGCLSYSVEDNLYYLFGVKYSPCPEPDVSD